MGGEVVGCAHVKMILLDVGKAGSEVVVMYAIDGLGNEVDLEEAWRDLMHSGDWCERGGVKCEEGDADFAWSEGGNVGWVMMKEEEVKVIIWMRKSIVGAGTEVTKAVGDDYGNEVGELCLVN